jgi:hypothetical protein
MNQPRKREAYQFGCARLWVSWQAARLHWLLSSLHILKDNLFKNGCVWSPLWQHLLP